MQQFRYNLNKDNLLFINLFSFKNKYLSFFKYNKKKCKKHKKNQITFGIETDTLASIRQCYSTWPQRLQKVKMKIPCFKNR